MIMMTNYCYLKNVSEFVGHRKKITFCLLFLNLVKNKVQKTKLIFLKNKTMADDKELLPKTLHNQLKLITSKANEVDFQKFKGISNHGNYCFVIYSIIISLS